MVAHEIGHSLHWPHSFSGLSGSEYDNPTDVMSGSPDDGWCEKAVAFGTTTAGRVSRRTRWPSTASPRDGSTTSQVHLQTSGTSTVTLDAPGGAGMQMVAAPDPGIRR